MDKAKLKRNIAFHFSLYSFRNISLLVTPYSPLNLIYFAFTLIYRINAPTFPYFPPPPCQGPGGAYLTCMICISYIFWDHLPDLFSGHLWRIFISLPKAWISLSMVLGPTPGIKSRHLIMIWEVVDFQAFPSISDHYPNLSSTPITTLCFGSLGHSVTGGGSCVIIWQFKQGFYDTPPLWFEPWS